MTNFIQATKLVTTNQTTTTLPNPFDSLLVVSGVTVATTNSSLLAAAILCGASNQDVILDGTAWGTNAITSSDGASAINVTVGQTGHAAGAEIGIKLTGEFCSITNLGLVTGAVGVFLFAGSTVNNAGTISATGTGVFSNSALQLYNTGTIIGNANAVLCSFTSTDEIVNAGIMRGKVDLAAGDDTYDGSAGTVYGLIDLGDGNDTALGGNGSDTFTDGSGSDEIDAGNGADIVTLALDLTTDTVDGGGGEDLLVIGLNVKVSVNLLTGLVRGATGTDLITGFEHVRTGGGNDEITGDGAANRLSGASGNDLLTGGGGDDRLNGGEGTNRLEGGDGNDRLTGGGGRDTLLGGAGNDMIYGSYDIDTATGGSGADIFVWRDIDELFVVTTGTFDRITDFDTNGDLIDLSAMDWDASEGDSAFTFVGSGPITDAGQVAVRQAGGNTFIDISFFTAGVASSIRLDGLVTVDAADFVL